MSYLGEKLLRETTIADLLESLRDILPLAESYLKHAPSCPDNAKLETARALIRRLDTEG